MMSDFWSGFALGVGFMGITMSILWYQVAKVYEDMSEICVQQVRESWERETVACQSREGVTRP